jgi:hypothetical protein
VRTNTTRVKIDDQCDIFATVSDSMRVEEKKRASYLRVSHNSQHPHATECHQMKRAVISSAGKRQGPRPKQHEHETDPATVTVSFSFPLLHRGHLYSSLGLDFTITENPGEREQRRGCVEHVSCITVTPADGPRTGDR